MKDPTITGLTHTDKMRILREVVLGGSPPGGESPEATDWRRQCETEVQSAYGQGLTVDAPFDSHDPD